MGTANPTPEPTACKPCSDFDRKRPFCLRANRDYDYMCEECQFNPRTRKCGKTVCGDFTSMGRYKCSIQGRKNKEVLDNKPCYWDVHSKTCTATMPTATCEEYGSQLSFRGCNALGAPYRGCRWNRLARKCLEKDEKLNCGMFKPIRRTCNKNMKQPHKGCMIQEGKCVPYQALKCSELTEMGKRSPSHCNGSKLNCLFTNNKCIDFPEARPNCALPGANNKGKCERRNDLEGLPCAWIPSKRKCI